MIIKGFDQLRKHVPDLNSPLGLLHVFLLPVIIIFLAAALFNFLPFTWIAWQLAAEFLLGSLGFGLLYLFFRYRHGYKIRFGAMAYSQAARQLVFPAVTLIAIPIAHIRHLPGAEILPYSGWNLVLLVLGWLLIAAGVLLGLRAMLTFGVDNLTMLYVYFPEESRLVN